MTKPPVAPTSCSLQTIVAEVRDRGSLAAPGRVGDLADTNQYFGPHYASHPSGQYDGRDLLARWDASVVPIMSRGPLEQPMEQLEAVTCSDLEVWRQQQERREGGLEQWVDSGQSLLPFKSPQVVTWPERVIPYECIAGILAAKIVHD